MAIKINLSATVMSRQIPDPLNKVSIGADTDPPLLASASIIADQKTSEAKR